MNLPNAHLAVVDREKITDYLLNPAHPYNGGKAKFFLGLAFKAEEWRIFADALQSSPALSQSPSMWSQSTASIYCDWPD
ncbi:MAG: hypothetical protein LC776_01280 [Acidobacteria bacterium]|nr:hypothetical protein [Acidobacteriota bacterium]